MNRLSIFFITAPTHNRIYQMYETQVWEDFHRNTKQNTERVRRSDDGSDIDKMPKEKLKIGMLPDDDLDADDGFDIDKMPKKKLKIGMFPDDDPDVKGVKHGSFNLWFIVNISLFLFTSTSLIITLCYYFSFSIKCSKRNHAKERCCSAFSGNKAFRNVAINGL